MAKVTLLLERGANVHGALHEGLYQESPLAIAAWMGSEECVRILLAHGAGEDRFSLQQALRSAFVDNGRNTAPLLIDAGAEVGLFEAVCMRDLKLVRKCIGQGDEVNERDHLGRTPLIYACGCPHILGEDIEEELLRAGADANARDEDGRTALSIVSEQFHPVNTRLVALLKEYGAVD